MSVLKFIADTTDNVRLTYNDKEPVTSSDVILHYHTLPGNNPQSRGDLIAFYEAEDDGKVAANATPVQIAPINRTLAESDARIELKVRQQRSYAFGYVQGHTAATLASTPFSAAKVSSLLALPKNTAISPLAYNISLNIASRGDIVVLTYKAIPGTEPSKSNAWIGVWKNENFDIAKDPEIFYPVTRAGASNTQEIEGLTVNTEYYLGYFQDGYNKTKASLIKTHLAACVVFTTVF